VDSFYSVILSSARQKDVLSAVDGRGNAWRSLLREPYAGAWQQNIEWTVSGVLENPTLYACLTRISTDTGKLPFTHIAEDTHGIWKPVLSSKLLKILRKPNRYQNHIQFKEWWILSKLIHGNVYVLKERDNRGNVVQLYILNPTYVTSLVSDDGSVFYALQKDKLNNEAVTVPASEIIHDRMNCLFHPLVGISPLFAAGAAASQGLKIEEDSTSFFSNGANPGGVLTAPGSISPEIATRLKEHWDSNYTGENAGKVAVLGDGLHYEPMKMTAVDSQLTEQWKKTDQAICSALHVPAYMVGVGPTPSQSNIEALKKDYYSNCLQIHIESMELCLDEGLNVPEGEGIELDLDVLFRMDSLTLIQMLKEGVAGKIFAPNEARKRLNLGPLAGGDSVYGQHQDYSLEALAKRDAKGDPFATGSQPAANTEPAEEIEDDTDKAIESKGLSLFELAKAANDGLLLRRMQASSNA
jgi:HK97 family phage portal protein